MRSNFKVIILTVLSTLMVIVLLQNTSVVTFKFLFWQVSMSRIILMPIILTTGFVAGYIVGKRLW